MYNWCLVPPDPEHITDQTYQDEELNKIISEYRKNQIYAKEHFEERKRELMQQAADEAKRAALMTIDEVVGIDELNDKFASVTSDDVVNASEDVVSASDLMNSMT